MEAQNKEKNIQLKNLRKFSFGNLKIRNKIIFGFFIVAIISGFLNYISNSLVVAKFIDFNRVLQLSSSIMADQEDLELAVENYISIKDFSKLPEIDFEAHETIILENIKTIDSEIKAFAQESTVSVMSIKNKELLDAEKEAIFIHKSLKKNDLELIKVFDEEEKLKNTIRNYVLSINDKELQESFLFFDDKSNEVTFEFKGRLHIHTDEWLEAFNIFKLYAKNNQHEIADLENYEILGLRISELLEEIEKSEVDEQNKVNEIRKIKMELHGIQGAVFEILMGEKIKSANGFTNMIVVAFLILTVVLTIVFGYIISYFITNPLNKLVNFTLDAGRGDFKKRIDIDTDDEIGQTAEAFNSMLDKVEESTQVLEIKINARTKMLRELSQDLEAQVNSKTKELREKITELELFNDLAVGRELKMVELKKDIEGLKQKNDIKKTKKKDAAVLSENKMNCWDFWNCEKKNRDKCPAYLSNSGRECWMISSGKCPRSKERGIEDCRKCAWYIKMNKA